MIDRCWPLLVLPLLANPISALAQVSAAGPAEVPAAVPAAVAVAELRSPGVPVSVAPDGSAAGPRLAYPLARAAESMDPWGWRYSQSRGAWRMHTGVDLAAVEGTPVLAALAGRVVLVEAISGYGTTVLLDHGDGWQTLYAHLERADVSLGQRLEQGDPLGGVGMTGAATGPHLHFELRRQGPSLQALDPTPHLPPLLPPPAPPPVLATIGP